MTTTQTLQGKRVTVAGRAGQLNGWNPETRLVTLYDEATNEQVTFVLDEGDAPVLAMLIDRNGHETRRLFVDHKAEEGAEADLCADCVRATESGIKRTQPCDFEGCDATGAFRNATDRKNLYLCPHHHALRGVPIRQNKWAPRVSEPLGIREREECLAKGGVTECRGEVRWRGGKVSAPLCNAHAGRVSASEGLADREIEGL